MPTVNISDIASIDPPETTAPPTIQDKVRAAATRNGVDPNLLLAMAHQESGGDQSAVSPKGATGVMQLMPGTAAGLGVNPNDPDQNIEGGARYFRQLLDRFGGNQQLALAAYNAGPGAVVKYGGVPPYTETQNYVSAVTRKAAAPVQLAQTGSPPTGPVPFSTRPIRGQATAPPPVPIAYDPDYGDIENGPATFSQIRLLESHRLAEISPPEDWMPRGGGQKITARAVSSIHARHNGLWDVNGRKLDASQDWVRAGLGTGAGGAGGGLKNLELKSVVDRKTGRKFMANYDPTTGALDEVEGAEPPDVQGLNRQYYYNPALKESGWYGAESLTTDPYGRVINRQGNVLQAAFTPQEINHERELAINQKENDYKHLSEQIASWKGQVDRGELGAKRSSFGVPIPWDYGTDKAKYYKQLDRYDKDQQAAIDKRYKDKEAYIQHDLEHRTPDQQPEAQQQQQQQQQPTAGRQAVTAGDWIK